MYGASLEGTWELFSPYLSGNASGAAVVASAAPLGDAARTAVEKTAQAFGYGESACTFATLDPAGTSAGARSGCDQDDQRADANTENPVSPSGAAQAPVGEDAPAASARSEAGALTDPQALFLMIEGLDPVFLIAADESVAHALEAAYHAPIELDSANRLLGRPVVAFRDLNALMGTPADKQRAWALLKTLPRWNAAR